MKRILLLFVLAFSMHAHAQSQCNATFTYTINNNVVTFNSTDSIIHGVSMWYPGDGSVNWGSYLSYAYNAPGTYTVKHFVIDSVSNCSDSSVQTINVQFMPSCSASFQYYSDSTNLSHYFFYDQSTIIGSSYKSFQWTINGAVVSQDESFAYIFPQTGSYQVCEQIGSYSGCTSTICKNISVIHLDSCTLNVSFTYSPEQSNPLAIKFSSTTETNSNVSYNWYFGDGTYDTSKSPVHLYTKGIYNATLQEAIRNDSLITCSSSSTATIYVNIGPADTCSANFTYTANPTKPNVISFTANSGQPIVSQQWTIFKNYDSADEIILQTNNPTYTFTDSALYYVSLKVVTESGCTANSNLQIVVMDSIAANTANPNSAQQIPAYPNPATNNVNLNVPLTANNNITINIFSAMGNLIITKQIAGIAGSNAITIPVQSLQSGVYYIQINYGNETSRSRFQKL